MLQEILSSSLHPCAVLGVRPAGKKSGLLFGCAFAGERKRVEWRTIFSGAGAWAFVLAWLDSEA